MQDGLETLVDAVRYFSDPDNCFNEIKQIRWPDGVVMSPSCGNASVGFAATRRLWQCKSNHPRKQFTVKVGTMWPQYQSM